MRIVQVRFDTQQDECQTGKVVKFIVMLLLGQMIEI